MSPIKRNGTYYLYVPKQSGGVALRTTGTSDPLVYRGMKRMLAELKDTRRWGLLRAVIDGAATLGVVYDHYAARTLDTLELLLSAAPLAPHVVTYLAACQGRGLAPRNVENIKRQLDAFLTVAMTTADLTTPIVTAWLAGLSTSPGTRRQYLYAVTGFTRYLVDMSVLPDYPLSRVKAPKKNPARMTYMDAATDEKIVQAARPDVRALFAFVKGTGCDLSTALQMKRKDVDLAALTARLKGTKTAERDVHEALIERWSLVYVAPACQVLPNALLFPGITRSVAAHQHEAACTAIGVEGYSLKDARHSVAVRMAKAGYTVFEIAEQLGNSPELVARVYARFIPRMAHRVTESVTRATGAQS